MNSSFEIWRDAPCKINLMLAITGTRADGFHNLVSLVAPTNFGDKIGLKICGGQASRLPICGNEKIAGTRDLLRCDAPGVPVDERNLVMRATQFFREAVPAGTLPPVEWILQKNVPHGAGLGGGSSDAASALLMLNEVRGNALSDEKLLEIAAKLGSDVPLFLHKKPVIMRGRGEQIQPLSGTQISILREREFLIFKPAFAVSTAEIYGKMRREQRFYVPAERAEKMLSDWLENPAGTPIPYFNNMEFPVFEKFLVLPALFAEIRSRFGLTAHMSGSGSACFVDLTENRGNDFLGNANFTALAGTISAFLGETAFLQRVKIA